ncbi:MAG: metallophosphoesterase [Idiomarina sp.]
MTDATEQTPVSIIQLTDCHLFSDPDARLGGVDTKANLTSVLAHIARYFLPQSLILTGDLSHDANPETLTWLQNQCLQHFPGSQVFWLPGNHDDPALLAQQLDQLNPLQEWQQNGWQLCLLNSHSGRPEGVLSSNELARLERLAQQGLPVAVFVHHHPLKLGCFIDRHMLTNCEPLLRLFSRYPTMKLLAHGHTHQESRLQHAQTAILGCPATSVQFQPKAPEFELAATKPGYRWLQLQPDGSFTTGVVRVVAGSVADAREGEY